MFRKKTANFSKLLCSIFLISVFISCEKEDEIIAIEQGDLLEKKLTVDNAEDLLIDRNGEVIGFFDDKMRRYQLDGTPYPTSQLKKDDNPYILMYTLYRRRNFGGHGSNRRSYHTAVTNGTVTNLLPRHFRYGNLGSIIISPWVELKLQDSNRRTIYTYQSRNTGYYNNNFLTKVGSRVANAAQYLVADVSDAERGDYCGFAWNRTGWLEESKKIPLYYGRLIGQYELGQFGLDDRIVAISINSRGKCRTEEKGILLSVNRLDYGGVNAPVQTTLIKRDASSIDPYFRGKISSIIPGGNYVESERTYGLSSTEAQTIRQNASAFYRYVAQNAKNSGRAYYEAMKVCEESQKHCNASTNGFEVGGIFATQACPPLVLTEGTQDVVDSFEDGSYGLGIFLGAATALDFAGSIVVALANPEFIVPSCYIAAGLFAGEASSRNVCSKVFDYCESSVNSAYNIAN